MHYNGCKRKCPTLDLNISIPFHYKMKTHIVSLLAVIVLMSACNTPERKINQFEKAIIAAEAQDSIPPLQREKLDTMAESLKEDLKSNRNQYTAEELERANKLIGRYAVLDFNIGLKELKEGLNDALQQLDGALESIGTDEANKEQ